MQDATNCKAASVFLVDDRRSRWPQANLAVFYFMPFDKTKYPKDWDEISKRIRARDGNKCFWCGVKNKAVGARDRFDVWHDAKDIDVMNSDAGHNLFDGDYPKIIKIVLTVMHWPDHDPMNCAEENLHAACQRCHNRMDSPMRKKNAMETWRKKKFENQLEIV